MSSMLVGQVLVLVAAPIVSRLYTPEQYGSLGMLMSVVAIAAVAINLRYDFAVLATNSDADARSLLVIGTVVSLPLVAIFCAVFLLLKSVGVPPFASLPTVAAPIGSMILLVIGANSMLRAWSIRHANFRAVNRALLWQGVGRAIAPIGFSAVGTGFAGLALGEAAGRALGTISLVASYLSVALVQRGAALLRESRHVIVANWRYPTVVMLSSLLDAAGSWAPLLAVGALFGTAAAGHYSMVLQMVLAPAALLGSAAGDVFNSEFARAVRNADAHALIVLKLFARQLAVAAAGIYACVALVSPLAFGFVFGEAWLPAGWLAAILAPFFAVALVASALSRALVVIGKPELKLKIDALLLLCPLLALYLSAEFGLYWAFGALTLANIVVYAIYLMTIFKAVRRWAGAIAPVAVDSAAVGLIVRMKSE
jgi:O-antigen/teichoic acid export membrane protein